MSEELKLGTLVYHFELDTVGFVDAIRAPHGTYQLEIVLYDSADSVPSEVIYEAVEGRDFVVIKKPEKPFVSWFYIIQNGRDRYKVAYFTSELRANGWTRLPDNFSLPAGVK